MNSHQCKLCLTKNYKYLIINVKKFIYKQNQKKKR